MDLYLYGTALKQQTKNKQKTNKKQTNNTTEAVQFALQTTKQSFVCPSELSPPPTQRVDGNRGVRVSAVGGNVL
jgi:hypothetical protein